MRISLYMLALWAFALPQICIQWVRLCASDYFTKRSERLHDALRQMDAGEISLTEYRERVMVIRTEPCPWYVRLNKAIDRAIDRVAAVIARQFFRFKRND